MRRCIALFAKNPVPGAVKTRLHAHCDPADAARLYRAFLLDSAALVAGVSAEEKIIAYAPADAEAKLRALLVEVGEFTYVAQCEGGLGARMTEVVTISSERGAEAVVLLGSDSPNVPTAYVECAFRLLEEHEVVIGPSTDGGYYLMGLQRGAACPFSDIDWSTGAVLEQTLERIGDQSLGLLPPWYDVDTPEDAALLRVHLRAQFRTGLRAGARSLKVLEELELPPPS